MCRLSPYTYLLVKRTPPGVGTALLNPVHKIHFFPIKYLCIGCIIYIYDGVGLHSLNTYKNSSKKSLK